MALPNNRTVGEFSGMDILERLVLFSQLVYQTFNQRLAVLLDLMAAVAHVLQP